MRAHRRRTRSNISEHSIERAIERIGLERKAAERFLLNGLRHGRTGDHYSGRERRFLESHAKGDQLSAIAYNGYCLVMCDDKVCLTVYALPDWFGKKIRYDHKKRIRNAKKYMRFEGQLSALGMTDTDQRYY